MIPLKNFSTNNDSILIDPDTMFRNDELDEGMQKFAINVQDKIKMKDNIAVSPFKKVTPTPASEYGYHR